MEKIVNKKNASIAASIIAIYGLSKWLISRIRAHQAYKKGREKLQWKLSKKKKFPDRPIEKKNQILAFKAYELSEKIRNGKYTIQEVLDVYMERAQELGRKYSISAEEMFEDAESRLSSILDTSDSILFGIPISIKDHIFQLGCCSSAGLVRNCFTPDVKDSIVVSLLRKTGCVPIVRGNTIQMMMWIETTNNIYGTAENPWDITRTPGGSSGGDAGLVAAGACLIGIGSDIGGSIRLPAAFCGVCGFKPSALRTSTKEEVAKLPKHVFPTDFIMKQSYGPIARCIEDLVLVLKSWWVEDMWKRDNAITPLIFNSSLYEDKSKLRIGYFTDNQIMECADVVKNVVLNTVDKLRNDGHDLIEMNTDLMPEILQLFFQGIFGMEGSYMLEELDGEDPVWPYLGQYFDAKYPGSGKILNLLLRLSGHKKIYDYISALKPLTYKELCELGAKVSDIKMKFNEYYQSQGFDVVICPIWALVAPRHKTSLDLMLAASYCCVWNLLDYPAGVVPIKLVEPGEDVYNSNIKDASIKAAKELMKGSIGLPVSLQVIGSTYQDEKVLRVMKIIQDYYNFFEKYHYPMLLN